MKRRSKIWLIFLIAGIICTIITRCKNAKAEGYDPWSGDPWQPPGWLTSEDPFLSPGPLETPSPTAAPSDGQKGPSGEGSRGIDSSGRNGQIRYIAGWWSRLLNGTQATIYWRDVWGSSTTFSPTSLNPWLTSISGGSVLSNQTFETARSFSNTTGTYSGSTYAENCGIAFSAAFSPNSASVLNNEMQFKFSCRWPISATLEANPNAAYTFEDLNLSYSDFSYYIPVTVFYVFKYTEGYATRFEWVRDDVFLSDLSFYSFTASPSGIPDDSYINSVIVHIIVNYDSSRNYIYNRVTDWYYDYDPSILTVPYPIIRYSARSNLNGSLKIFYTENAQNRSWLLRTLQGLFLPDPDAMASLFNSYLGDPSSGGSSVVLGMREILYNHLRDTEASDAVITLPSIDLPLGSQTVHLFDGYSFNLTEFYNGAPGEPGVFRTLTSGVQFMTSTILFAAFFQSLWAIVCKIFGLHLWQGVQGEDAIESD